MGRLVSEKDIINKNIESYLDQSTSKYSRFLETTPTYVVYYNKHSLGSTIDEGLEDVHKTLGRASAKRFNKIDNLPIYGIDGITHELNKEEWGAESSYEGSAIVIPNTIKPLPEDYFAITYVNKCFLFRVNNVVNDKINGKNFYRIEFSFNKMLKDVDEIGVQVIGDYEVIVDNIGTELKCIIEKDEYIKIDYLEKLEYKLFEVYNEFFYNKKLNLYLYSFGTNKLYYQMLLHFISENKVFKFSNSFMSDVYIRDVLPKPVNFFNDYKQTLFFALEKNNIDFLKKGDFYKFNLIEYRYSQFALHHKNYYNITPHTRKKEEVIIQHHHENHCDELYHNDILYKIRKGELYNNSEYIMQDIIIKYLNGMTITYDDLDLLNEYYFTNDLTSFLYVPIISFILKSMKKDLTNKINL